MGAPAPEGALVPTLMLPCRVDRPFAAPIGRSPTVPALPTMGWAALSARNESVAAFAAELPARAPASSPEAVAALADGAAGAAQELEALADAAEVAGEAAPPGLTAALAAVALPPCLLDKGMLSQHHPGLRGQVDVFAAAWDLVEDAAEGRRRLADVRPGVVLRLAPPGTPAAQQLQRQCHEWLHGTEHHPVPQALHQQRSQQLQAFSNAMVSAKAGEGSGQAQAVGARAAAPLLLAAAAASCTRSATTSRQCPLTLCPLPPPRRPPPRLQAASAAAATNPHTATLLRFAAQGWAYFEPLSCRPALRVRMAGHLRGFCGAAWRRVVGAWPGLPASPRSLPLALAPRTPPRPFRPPPNQALLRTFAPVADIRIDCCLGPATSLPAVSLACVLATGGMHIERNEQAGLAELFSVLAGLCSAGSLQHLRPLLKGVTVCYSLSNKALEPFTDPITGDEVIRISQEVRPGKAPLRCRRTWCLGGWQLPHVPRQPALGFIGCHAPQAGHPSLPIPSACRRRPSTARPPARAPPCAASPTWASPPSRSPCSRPPPCRCWAWVRAPAPPS